jgi:hypothetical protein
MDRIDKPLSKDDKDSLTACDDTSRRNFAKRLLGIGALSSLSVSILPDAAMAWLDGKFSEREDLEDAIKALVKTYSDTKPYPHKFNDALVKMHLRNLDFSLREGILKERAEHYVWTLGVVVDRHIKKGIEMFGKDAFLWGNFERTSCSYQLYEHIDIKDGERSFPCPFKPILDQIQKGMGTYQITWNDVCNKWCVPVWSGFASNVGVKIKAEPGDICRVKVS